MHEFTVIVNNDNYKLLKKSELINSNMGQQLIKNIDQSFKSFFALKKKCIECKIPHYLSKDVFITFLIGQIRLNNNKLTISYSREYNKEHAKIEILIAKILNDKKIKEIRIISKSKARFFEILYVYEVEIDQRNLNTNNALGLDLGVDNSVSCVATSASSFIYCW